MDTAEWFSAPAAQRPASWEAWMRRLLARWPWLAVLSVVGGSAGFGAAVVLPGWYESTLQLAITPVEDPTTGVTQPGDGAGELMLLASLTQSRKITSEVAARFKLREAYGVASDGEAARRLEDHRAVVVDRKANLVILRVEDRDPTRARDMARAFADLASETSAAVWSSRAGEHRRRIEERLKTLGQELAAAQDAMREFREREHIVDIHEQTRVTVTEAAALDHLAHEKRIHLGIAKGFGSRESDEVQRARREAEAVRPLLRQTIEGGPDDDEHRSSLLPLDRLPALQREHDRLQLAVDTRRAAYELLARDVEQLRALEMRPTGRPELVDPPVVPWRRVRPARPMLAAFGAMVGLLAGVLVVIRSLLRRPRPLR